MTDFEITCIQKWSNWNSSLISTSLLWKIIWIEIATHSLPIHIFTVLQLHFTFKLVLEIWSLLSPHNHSSRSTHPYKPTPFLLYSSLAFLHSKLGKFLLLFQVSLFNHYRIRLLIVMIIKHTDLGINSLLHY